MSYSEKYQQLEYQIEKLQNEVKRLKKEEADNRLPGGFNIDYVKKVIAGDTEYLEDAFDFSGTPQGYDYWGDIYNEIETLRKKDIIQLQKWVIIYLEQNQK
jgi:hypothetical protein